VQNRESLIDKKLKILEKRVFLQKNGKNAILGRP